MGLDSYMVGVPLIIVIAAYSVAGLLVVRKFFHLDKIRQCHEVGGYLLSVVGTMYAVLLGLVVVDAMTKFQTARNVFESEANSLADVFILSESLPHDKCQRIRQHCTNYAKEVVEVEWNSQKNGVIDMKARREVIALMKEISNYEPVTENQKAVYPKILDESCQLWDNRRSRTNIAQYGVPNIEWIVLIIGGIATVVFTYFFGVESVLAQSVMTAVVSLLISLNLYLVLLFGAPFSGDLHIGSDAMKVDQAIFEGQFGMRGDVLKDEPST